MQYLIVLILLLVIQNSLVQTKILAPALEHDCNFEKGMLNALQYWIKKVHQLEIITLIDRDEKVHSSHDLLDSLLKRYRFINRNKSKVILKTFRGVSAKAHKDINLTYYDASEETEPCLPERHFRTSFAKNKVIILVANAPDKFIRYLEYEQRNNLRYFHILITSLQLSQDLAASTLKELWNQKKLMNSLLYMPCGYNDYVYTYKPFYLNQNRSYGAIKKYRALDIRRCPTLVFNNVKNLNGLPLNISVFARKTTSVRRLPKSLQGYRIYNNIPNTTGLYGFDGVLTSEISLAMNFSIIRQKSQEFGRVFSNFSGTGTFIEVFKGEIELQGNPRFVEWGPQLKFIEYTTFISQEKVCVIVKKSEIIPRWMRLFVNVRPTVWGFFMLNLIVCSCFNNILLSKRDKGLVLSFFEIFGAMFSVASHLTERRGHLGRRLFLSCILFGALNLSCVVAALLYDSFTTVVHFPDINTLENFDRLDATIMTSTNVFRGSQNKIYQNLEKKIRYEYKGFGMDWVVSSKKYAAVERLYDAQVLLRSTYINEDGSAKLHIIPECPGEYFLALIVPRGSPFLFEIDAIIARLREAGLPIKWFWDIADAIVIGKIMKIESYNTRARSLDFETVHFVFYLLLLGHVLSGLVFIGEIAWANKNRQPKMFKYVKTDAN